MIKKSLLNSFANSALFITLIKLVGFIKVSFILGSHALFFSAVGCITPLSGAFGGITGALGLLSTKLLLSVITGSIAGSFFAFHIPGFCAALYWATRSRIVQIAPALLCMALFIIHPVGKHAAIYALFWIIPIAISFSKSNSLFARSLGSTFTAHAVGSVIWLYTIPMTCDQWLMLLPVVIVERLLFASGMLLAYHAIQWCLKTVSIANSNKHIFLKTSFFLKNK